MLFLIVSNFFVIFYVWYVKKIDILLKNVNKNRSVILFEVRERDALRSGRPSDQEEEKEADVQAQAHVLNTQEEEFRRGKPHKKFPRFAVEERRFGVVIVETAQPKVSLQLPQPHQPGQEKIVFKHFLYLN